MKLLQEKILSDGSYSAGGIVRVDSFLNHQIDTAFLHEIALEFARRFEKGAPTKILTVEASGIAIAALTGYVMGGLPVVFAKKGYSANLGTDAYYTTTIHSFTKGIDCGLIVSKKYLAPEDRVLILDDFLATGEAITGLIRIVREAGAQVAGVGAVIEKSFQEGGQKLRDRGIRVESLAKIQSVNNDEIAFC